MKLIKRHKYILLYIIIWLLFSGIYYAFFNKSFIYSNPTYDPAFKEFKLEITKGICSVFNEYETKIINDSFCHVSLKKKPLIINKKACVDSKCGTTDLKAIHIKLGKLTNTGIEVKFYNFIHFFYNKINNMGPAGGSGDLFELSYSNFHAGMNRYTIQLKEPGSIYKISMPENKWNKYKSLTHFIIDKGLISKKKLNFAPKSDWFQLKVKQQIPEYIWHINDYVNGAPKKEPSFRKMLYFSGVTILTIGYGDISPLSWPVRFLAILEGFIGVFLIGFFIADEYEKSKERRKRNGPIWKHTRIMLRRLIEDIEIIQGQMQKITFPKIDTIDNFLENIPKDEKDWPKGLLELFKIKSFLQSNISYLIGVRNKLNELSVNAPSDIEESELIFKTLIIFDDLEDTLIDFGDDDQKSFVTILKDDFLNKHLQQHILNSIERILLNLETIAIDKDYQLKGS